VAMVAFAVYSACVDPDRVLRALRPLAGRSALTATLISRLVPVAAADASRLRDAGRLRGPAAAPLGRAALARRLLTGSLDRAVDVAATLELRGYSLDRRRRRSAEPFTPLWVGKPFNRRSRFDGRFYATGAVVLLAAIAAKLIGADGFSAYPTLEVGLAPSTIALSILPIVAGLAPLQRRPRRIGRETMRTAASETARA